MLVTSGLPRGGLARSAIFHILLIAAIYGAARIPRAQIQIIEPQPEHQTITYYRVADELPALHADAEPAPSARAADPLPAKQAVMSLPTTPENFRQRIIVPGAAKLGAEQQLPNVVAWNPTLPSPPVAGAEKFSRDIQLDRSASVVAPAPEDLDRALGVMTLQARTAVPPPAKDVNGWNPLAVPTPVAVGPTAVDSARKLSGDKLAALEPSAIAPRPGDSTADLGAKKLGLPQPIAVAPAPADVRARNRESLLLPERAAIPPMAQDSARALGDGKAGEFNAISRAAAAPAPTTSSSGPGGSAATAPQRGSGQMIVLGLSPAQVNGAIEVPSGNLNGSFAASPEGKAGASGAPAQVAGDHGPGGNARAPSDDALSGVNVAGNSVAADVPVVESSASAPANVPHAGLLPPIRRESVTDLARSTGPMLPQGKVEDPVFHARRSYSMALNMPNLSSVAGSWIIHFAELVERSATGSHSHLVPPTIVMKADPAYPADLVREGVQGTVRLYAVIHADGSVGNVRVLEGVDSRLDHYATVALSESRFRPATRDGSGVEIEAVVEIPFRSQALR
ncbi:MAG TPA: TonB family protein [Candidatus Binataceae bacterium]|nr:TonB family protein [Candidatus Binataceae bacterium]